MLLLGSRDSMRTEFRRAEIPADIRSLLLFDRKVFRPSDRFPREYWEECEAYWMIVDGRKAGCCAFVKHVDFQGDLPGTCDNPRLQGSLYISTTGILPAFQAQGLGTLLKAWEIAYARRRRFRRIVTNTRAKNKKMIQLNEKFGFQTVRVTPGYYRGPKDATVVMELLIASGSRSR